MRFAHYPEYYDQLNDDHAKESEDMFNFDQVQSCQAGYDHGPAKHRGYDWGYLCESCWDWARTWSPYTPNHHGAANENTAQVAKPVVALTVATPRAKIYDLSRSAVVEVSKAASSTVLKKTRTVSDVRYPPRPQHTDTTECPCPACVGQRMAQS